MISFFVCLTILIASYFTYGKFVEYTLSPDERVTPAVEINDGVDYVVMPQWKLFLIQLLNIAGTGPIFGALTGAIWGPIVFLWITLGTIFAGGVHDYFSGMLSERFKGKSISEVTGEILGNKMLIIMRVFSVILLIMCGTVFAVGPAELLSILLNSLHFILPHILTNGKFWLLIILFYYLVATFLPIDKIIGKFYPVFGIVLIIMAIGVSAGTIRGYEMPEIWNNFQNMHPEHLPVWSFMFITVACGAISGFHATQSPIMARCIKSEKQGRMVFYGAMVSEGIIALIWAAAGCAVMGSVKLLAAGGGGPESVYIICRQTMGSVGMILAVLGVIACPITSGDTAFRSARLTIADWFNINQNNLKKRFIIAFLVLTAGAIISQLDYSVVWRYFSWTNQTLAMIVLWAASMYLYKAGKNYFVTMIPAVFMSAVSVTYFVMAKECLGLIPYLKNNIMIAYPVGIITALVFLAMFFYFARKENKG